MEGNLCRGPHATMTASAVLADQRGCARWAFRERWLLQRAEQCCPGLAGACPWDKGSGQFWVVFILKPLCWLSERREGFTARGWRALPPLVRDRPIRLVPAYPAAEGYGGKRHWPLPDSRAGRGVFISPVFVLPSLNLGYRVVLFGFVFLKGRKEEERRAVRLLPTQNQCPLLLAPGYL